MRRALLAAALALVLLPPVQAGLGLPEAPMATEALSPPEGPEGLAGGGLGRTLPAPTTSVDVRYCSGKFAHTDAGLEAIGPSGLSGSLDAPAVRQAEQASGVPVRAAPAALTGDMSCGPDPDIEPLLRGVEEDEAAAPAAPAEEPGNATVREEDGPAATATGAKDEDFRSPPEVAPEPVPADADAPPQGTPQGPVPDLEPSPVAVQGGWTRQLLVWSAVAAAALVPSLALKLLSLLALRRGRQPSPLRDEVLRLLAAEPGMHHMELVRRVGRGNGTVEHHVLALVREGRVQRLRTPGYTCYFLAAGPARPADGRVAQARASVRGRTRRRLVAALAGGPARSLSELAEALGIAASTAHYHARRLAAAGVLAEERSGARLGLALTELGRAVAPAQAGASVGAPEGPAELQAP